mmetsp:Transcript_58800/g.162607  ORF Transcript_58800/g.162607 Transcript_58800/m.162607 type:complete len:251 (+) Transcript_58800:718-1470(+)
MILLTLFWFGMPAGFGLTARGPFRELLYLTPGGLVLPVEAVELPLVTLRELVPNTSHEQLPEAEVNAVALEEESLRVGPPRIAGGTAPRLWARWSASPAPASCDGGPTLLQVRHFVQQALLARLQLLRWCEDPERLGEGRWDLPRGWPPLPGRHIGHVGLPLQVRPCEVEHAERHHEVPEERADDEHPSEGHDARRVPEAELQRRAANCKVGGNVAKPLAMREVLLAVVSDDVEPQDECLRCQEEHGQRP